jgi:ATP-dependent RNA helicase DeaD
MTQPATEAVSFSDLGLPASILAALADVGYESPSPIQAACIPALLEGGDLLGQAQTGTGKTGAFALPILARIDLARREPQALVLVPTRELAIQVAEAFQKYASHMPGFHVLPIYGGQSYTPQLSALKRGTHVIVATPGRVIDHLERGTLNVSTVSCVVLDEADEMLQMGFVDPIESILARLPESRQIALYSATMAPAVRRIADRHLRSPRVINIRAKTITATNIRQRYWMVEGTHKLDALTRILEVETFDAILVFTRTKQSTAELAEKLEARGFAAAALNGDIQQSERERTVQALKSGKIDIIVATDVAARGLDVPRVSHVINFDVPYDSESYIHRIGRTGRMGRSGEAILFISPRERHMLRIIERATRQPIEQMTLPSVHDVNRKRVEKWKVGLTAALASPPHAMYRSIIEEYVHETGADPLDVAAALAGLGQGGHSLLLPERSADATPPAREGGGSTFSPTYEGGGKGKPKRGAATKAMFADGPGDEQGGKGRRFERQQRYRLEVGREQGVQPGNIVGLLAHEADLSGAQINKIDIYEDHTLVSLPELPPELMTKLRKLRLKGKPLEIVAVEDTRRPGPCAGPAAARRRPRY